MKFNTFITIFFILSICCSITAQETEKKRVAIPNFIVGGELTQDAGEEIADLLMGQVAPSHFVLIKREEVKKLIDDTMKSNIFQESSTYIEELKKREIDWLIIGKVYGRMGTVSLSYRILSADGKDFRDSFSAKSWDKLLDNLFSSFRNSPLYSVPIITAPPITSVEPQKSTIDTPTPPVNVPVAPKPPTLTSDGLYAYEFTLDRDSELVDGITYDYIVYVDGKPIDPKRFHKENKLSDTYFTIEVPKDLKTIRIYAGYRYSEFELATLQRVRFLSEIDGICLVNHLKGISAKGENGPYKAMGILEYLVISKKNALKKLSVEEVEKLTELVLSWQFYDEGAKRQRKNLIEALDTLSK